jgi:hypothetical protein
VKYDEPDRRTLQEEMPDSPGEVAPFDDDISEEEALGGYVSFLENTKQLDDSIRGCFYLQWLTPLSGSTRYPRRVLHVEGGFQLHVFAAKSGISNAGDGLFIECHGPPSHSGKCLELEAGQLLDLGVYGPLQNSDRKSEFEFELKNFLHAGGPDVWCWAMAHHENNSIVIDITDDRTGDIHEEARKNVLVYANEVNGKGEIPTIHAVCDPVSILDVVRCPGSRTSVGTVGHFVLIRLPRCLHTGRIGTLLPGPPTAKTRTVSSKGWRMQRAKN